jgi:hypothetical protein
MEHVIEMVREASEPHARECNLVGRDVHGRELDP